MSHLTVNIHLSSPSLPAIAVKDIPFGTFFLGLAGYPDEVPPSPHATRGLYLKAGAALVTAQGLLQTSVVHLGDGNMSYNCFGRGTTGLVYEYEPVRVELDAMSL